MDPTPIIPQEPEGEIPKKPGIDLGEILLPKKEAPLSTERINAGALLEQEQSAVLTVQKATLPKPEPSATPQPPPPKKDEPVVRPIETYQGDIERLVQTKNVSVVSIAAEEAARRGKEPLPSRQEGVEYKPLLMNILMVGAGVLMLAAAIGVLVFIFRPAASVSIANDIPAPFINVDQTLVFTVPQGTFKRAVAMSALEEQRKKVLLSLGLVSRLLLARPVASADQKITPLSTEQILAILGPNVPDSLLRALDPQEYLLGIHSYDGNQPFLVMKTASYEQAFSGMLEWEHYMRQDLSPLFVRTPRVHLMQGDTASSSQPPTPTFVQTGFIDRIVENHDARVVENSVKDILLLWTFLNRNTLVITTNGATLREIISRLKNAPILPTP
ncbi:MAG: hypothetical protein G01um101456_689 [Parcubacteria group bacterium Gr01-1014_56]|nr:MAG: hypothetical protein G01um101456_689 [Parcubacteria group bacterium Gr01-1014_56]